MSGTLHDVLSVTHIVGSDVFSAAMLRTHCYVSVATSSISASITLLTTSRLRQQYKGNVLLRCLANGGYAKTPQGYITLHVQGLFICFCSAHCILYIRVSV
jgi:hypothetical protein